MKILAGILAVFAATSAQADEAPDFTLATARNAGKVEVTVTPPAAHHINVKAPMDLEDLSDHAKLKPKSAKEAKVVFVLPDTKPRQFQVTLYLCDNANTYCEKHAVAGKWAGSSAKQAPATKPSPTAFSATSKSAAQPSVSKHGFIVNNPDEALARAKAENKPLLIDFFGIWCPPCNMLDEEVFPKTSFKKAAAGFVKLKLDSDSDISFALKSKYRVNGYPTILFVSPDGEEIGRFAGFRPLSEFVTEVNKAWEGRNEPYSKLKAKADNGDRAARDKVGLIHFERHDFELAASYLEGTELHREQLYSARIGALDEKVASGETRQENRLIELLNKANSDFPETWDSLDRRLKLADLYETRKNKEAQATELKEVVRIGKELAAHPEKLKGLDATPADTWALLAEAQKSLGNDAESKQAWKRAADEYRKQLQRLGKGKEATERGYNLELAYCLWSSGDFQSAEKIYQRLEKQYPGEFTFFYQHGNMKLAQKDVNGARTLAEKAFQNSYGDNKLTSAVLMAKVFEAEGKPKEGVEFIRKTLAGISLPEDQKLRTHRHVKRLKSFEEKFAQKL